MFCATHGALAQIPNDFETLYLERQKAVAAVKFFVQNEIDRNPAQAMGLVLDQQGHVVLLDGAVPSWLPPERLKGFEVQPLGADSDPFSAEYLGQNTLTGWHYLRIEEAGRSAFEPIVDFGQAPLKIGEFVWGVAAMGEDWNFTPYFLSGRISAQEPLPWLVGFSDRPVATPGSAVFNASGAFVGWSGSPTTDEKVIIMQGRKFQAAVQMVRESNSFLTAEAFFRLAGDIPESPIDSSVAWPGIAGMQSLDREVAEVMGLSDQGALVVSNVVEGGPADAAGIQSRDIVVGVNGEPLPKFVPDFVTIRWFEKQILKREPGETMVFDVVSGNQGKQVPVTLGNQPTSLKEAERQYFDALGMSARELTLADALAQRELTADVEGAVVDFVKPNSPVQSAELQAGDWLLEVDGQPVETYAAAIDALQAVANDSNRNEFVMLIKRNNETKLLRAKLN